MASDSVSSVLVVDISHAYWTTALGMRAALAAVDVVMRDIRSIATNYDRIVICPDPKGPSWRKAICPEYKANRPPRSPEQWAALDRLIDYCDHQGWCVLYPPEHPDHVGHYYEADDVIATAVNWIAEHTQASTDILTGDSDLAMLVDDTRCIRLLRRYNGTITPMTWEKIEDWIKLPPSLIIEAKALAGDGDGYKPFPGIAKAGAVALLNALPPDTVPSAKAVVSTALAAGIKKNKDGKTDNVVSRVLNEGGLKQLEFGYAMARLCADAPIDCAVILEQREARTHSDVTDSLLPEDEPRSGQSEGTRHKPVSTALSVTTPGGMITPAEASGRLRALREVIRATLVPGTDYQKYAWAPKPFLHKPGAEKLANFFGLVPHYECVEKIEDWQNEFFFYRYRCTLSRRSDGAPAGDKVASCNSRESKYTGRWEYESKVPAHIELDKLRWREFLSRKGPERGKKIRQYWVPNEEVCSLVHTIDAMAQKRAYVLAVREATNTGGIFDVDDDLRAAQPSYDDD
jgi:5'-3' exonuclease